MDEIGASANLLIDGAILVCLVIAIVMGGVLLWQILSLRRERFKFDQMTQSLNGQLSIFQSAMSKGRDDIEVKIQRLDRILDQARSVADELQFLIEAGENSKRSSPAPQPQSRPQAPRAMTQAQSQNEERRPLFSIVDPEFTPEVKEDAKPAVDDFSDLSASDRAELSQLGTPAEKALMAALKRAGRR